MNYEARKIRLTCGEGTVREWAGFMLAHLEEVPLALRQEHVRHEMWFMGEDRTSLFLIGVMDVDDVASSTTISEKSRLSVDVVHREFKANWDRASIEKLEIDKRQAPSFEQCELLFEARSWSDPHFTLWVNR